MFTQLKDLLKDIAFNKLELNLTDDHLEKFSIYGELLIKWNDKVNLTSIIDPEEVIIKHFIDSLTLVKLLEGHSLADIGTGAGFPGMPLKIVKPDLEVTLVDSLAKRLEFLKEVIKELDLDKITTLHARAEDIGRDPKYRAKFDIVTSRAVARLPVLIEYAIPLVKVGGFFLASKGSQVNDEILEADKALKQLNCEITRLEAFSLSEEAEHRTVIMIKKIKETPKEYPRKAGIPAKKPIL